MQENEGDLRKPIATVKTSALEMNEKKTFSQQKSSKKQPSYSTDPGNELFRRIINQISENLQRSLERKNLGIGCIDIYYFDLNC